jgi:uncharacterized membrane protein YccC
MNSCDDKKVRDALKANGVFLSKPQTMLRWPVAAGSMSRALGAGIERSVLLGKLRDHRAELALALRATVAAVVSFVLSRVLHLPLPLWTVLTAVILTQATFGSSLKATLDYLASTLCGSVYAGTISVLIPHESLVAQAGVLALSVAPLALLAGMKPAFSAATFTSVLVLLAPGIAHVGPIESAVYRVVEVAIGALTAFVVSLLVLPTRAYTMMIEAAARMLDLMAQALPELAADLTEARDAATLRRLQDGIGEIFSRLQLLAMQATHELIGLFAASADPGPLLRTLLRLRHDFVILGRAAAAPLPGPFQKHLGPALQRVAAVLADALRDMADALVAGRKPPRLDAVERSLEEFAHDFAAVRQDGLMVSLPVDAVERIFALGFALDQLSQHLRDLDRYLREHARGR